MNEDIEKLPSEILEDMVLDEIASHRDTDDAIFLSNEDAFKSTE